MRRWTATTAPICQQQTCNTVFMWIFWRCFIFLVKVKSVIRWWLRISQQESEVLGFHMSQKQKWEMVRRVSVIFATFLSCLDLFSYSCCCRTTFMLFTPHQQLNEQMHDPLMLVHWSMCTVLILNSFSCAVADTHFSLTLKTYKYKNVMRKMNEKLFVKSFRKPTVHLR